MLTPKVHQDHEAMSHAAADWLAERIAAQPDSLLCLATGSTPLRCYQTLAGYGRSLFERLRVIKLDEWADLPMASPASCETFLRTHFIEPLCLQARYTAFHSQPPDFRTECERIAKWLGENGPIDLCVLGLGLNGHLGFNEPSAFLHPHAHIAKLSAASLQHTMIAAEKTKPSAGLTLGMADILQSRQILLLVSGPAKREPLQRLLTQSITSQYPATFLHLHPNVSLFCDKEAHPKSI